jgi:O-antigen/teichoic acid export membrane protein
MSFKKSIFATLGLNVYSFIIGFFNSIMSTRILGAEGKGIFAIYSSSIELFALVLGFGLPHALIFFAAKDSIARNKLFNSSLVYILFATILFFAIVSLSELLGFQSFFLPAPFTSNFFKITLVLNFLCLSGWYLIVSIINGHRYFQQTKFISFVSITVTAILYIILFIQAFNGHSFNSDSFYLIQLVAAVLTLIMTIYYHVKLVSGLGRKDFISLQEGKVLVKYGLVYYLSNFLLFANTKMDYWFINYFSGSYELGIYSLSSNVALLIFLMPNAFGLVLFAFKAKSDLPDVESRTAFLCRFTVLVTFLFSCFLWLFSEPLIVLLYGQEFRASAMPLRIILIGVIPFTVFTLLKNYFAGANNLKAFLAAALFGFMCTIILDILLIKPYGIIGAAVATAISYSMSSVYLIYVFSKRANIPLIDILVFNRADYNFTKELGVNFFKKK